MINMINMINCMKYMLHKNSMVLNTCTSLILVTRQKYLWEIFFIYFYFNTGSINNY